MVVCQSLVRIFRTGAAGRAGVEVQALQGLDLTVARGELTALVGASGSGKSTLLGILAGLDAPSAGTAEVAGADLGALKRRERTAYRRRTVGVVQQQTARNLLPYLTARENVQLPMGYVNLPRPQRAARALELLDLMGIAAAADRTPAALSGGEQQRVAIAVALANRPELLLADEPTGELDSATAAEVFDALRTANRELGTTVLIVTHDAMVAEQVRRTVRIRDGRTATELLRRAAGEAEGSPLVAQEYTVLDRVGRLQLPREFTESLGLAHRVRLVLERDHIGVWPDHGDPAASATGE
ncbi:ABC transporter ATP-binding protein [Kitasatospora sp. NBC_01287]|uniref:ABC transporter ATP-binding protein n=1 Tax=Kitasatospora sp. NBC_01287 TaxID=2903573 RepID=UPI0022554DAC|nr:ABC transporter ATP-binding protein [Kitasatospora sp. NBC_01287]MCX4750399.1 ABC transporter ATP-binding protein [Kitasatospora sp. NBC_01287]